MNSFSSAFSQILKIAQVKSYLLAESIGYDASYINKWIRGTRLPAESSIDLIAESTAAYCVENTTQAGLDRLCNFLNLPSASSRTVLKSAISGTLKGAFFKDKGINKATNLSVSDRESAIDAFAKRALMMIRQSIKADEELHIIVSADIFMRLIDDLYDDSAADNADKGKTLFKILLNPEHYSDRCLDIVRLIIRSGAAASYPPAIELYESTGSKRTNIDTCCIIKNHAAINYIKDDFSNKTFPICVLDATIVNELYYSAKAFLQRNTIQIRTLSSTDPSYSYNLGKRYISKESKVIYKFFQYPFSDINFLKEAITFGSETDFKTLSDYYNKGHADSSSVFMYESTIFDFCLTGRYRPAGNSMHAITLTPELRKKVLAQMLNQICISAENNDIHHTLRIIKDDFPYLKYNDIQSNVSFSDQIICLIPSNSTDVTYIESKRGIELFNQFFNILDEAPEQHVMSPQDSQIFIKNAISCI